MEVRSDGVVMIQLICLRHAWTNEPGSQSVPIGVGRIGFFKNFASPIDARADISQPHPILHPSTICPLPASVDMNDTGLGLLALGQTQIGGNRRTGGLVAALKPTQRIENKPYLALFRLPGFDKLDLQWLLAGIIAFPKLLYR